MTSSAQVHRRTALRAGLAGAALLLVRPARAQADALAAPLAAFTGGVTPKTGRVTLEIAELVENGNTVPVTVRVASPMTEGDYVRRIALFAERNPDPAVAVFHLSPRNGRAVIATRMRLATSQQVLAVAMMSNGSCWQAALEVVVTLAACVEG